MNYPKLIAAATFAIATLAAQALDVQPYSAAALASAQANGKPVALHFHADWCPTCRAQDKSIATLKSDKDLNMVLLSVDYDKETTLEKKLGVQMQSTIIVYKGAKETGRLAGDTSAEKIKAVLKTAL